jgi:hypothetical protein
MSSNLHLLQSRLFLGGLFLLVVNDFCLKAIFGNWFTGKLSDFAGLFIFPVFLTALFPNYKKAWVLLTAVLFTIWKSPLSEPVITVINRMGIGIGRTVDYTDLMALLVLPFAYHYDTLSLKKIQISPLMVGIVAIFAFCATTLPPSQQRTYVGIHKTYTFRMSKKELIGYLNGLTVRELRRTTPQYFDATTNIFYSPYNRRDTLAVLLDENTLQDTIRYVTFLADIRISGDTKTSQLELINVYKFAPAFRDKDYRQKTIREFEKRVVKKVKMYEHAVLPNK